MSQVDALSFAAALNPTLVTATTVMLLLARPSRLMLGYWLGAMMTSITLGLIIVFSLEDSGAVNTTQNTLSPAADIVLGTLALALAFVIGTDRHAKVTARRAERSRSKGPPKWQQTLSKGTARTTFVVGALLTLPGASYLAGLHDISKLHYSTAHTVLIVVGFNLVMLLLLEVPLVAFWVAPVRTRTAIDGAKAWSGRHGSRLAARALVVVGACLVIKGLAGLL